jgi:hypothetical protein
MLRRITRTENESFSISKLGSWNKNNSILNFHFVFWKKPNQTLNIYYVLAPKFFVLPQIFDEIVSSILKMTF